jgi:uncharacterized protein YecE (DUF72 family)
MERGEASTRRARRSRPTFSIRLPLAQRRARDHRLAMSIRIGCGSWADDEYVGLLFPKSLPKTERLRAYTQWFDRIELNATYHLLPSRSRIAGWSAQTPAGFKFDVKLPYWFSDNPRSSITGPSVSKLLSTIQPIIDEQKLGGFLLTMPVSFGPAKSSLDELDGIAEKLAPFPVAVELRDRRWVEGERLAETLDYFRRNKLVWVALDLPPIKAVPLLPAIDEVTHPAHAYMRLHGRNPNYLKRGKDASERHNYEYSPAELEEIAARIRTLAAKAEHVHVSVNTHYENFAPKAALALRKIFGQPVPPPLSNEPNS